MKRNQAPVGGLKAKAESVRKKENFRAGRAAALLQIRSSRAEKTERVAPETGFPVVFMKLVESYPSTGRVIPARKAVLKR